MLGEELSSSVTPASLAARRESWQPVRDHLNEAEKHGRAREWVGACGAFLDALEVGGLDWGMQGTPLVGLPLKIATVAVLAEDEALYARLCRELAERAVPGQLEFSSIALLRPDAVSPRTLSNALEIARGEANRIPDAEHLKEGQRWTWLKRGIAEYRAGNARQALEALGKARKAFNLNCSGIAHAFSSLAARQIGDVENSSDYLARAESNYQQILGGNAERLSKYWHRVAQFELALAEAGAAQTVR